MAMADHGTVREAVYRQCLRLLIGLSRRDIVWVLAKLCEEFAE